MLPTWPSLYIIAAGPQWWQFGAIPSEEFPHEYPTVKSRRNGLWALVRLTVQACQVAKGSGRRG
jgi:hypothetical protein